MLTAGQRFVMRGRSITVTTMQVDVGQRVRDEPIAVARRGEMITHGELKAAANLTHPPTGWVDS